MTSVATTVVTAAVLAAAVAVHRGPHPGARLRGVHGRGGVSRGPLGGRRAARALFIVVAHRHRRSESAVVRSIVQDWSRRLRAGASAGAALSAAIDEVPRGADVLARTRATLTVGGDVVNALRSDAERLASDLAPQALRACSACWAVAEHHGGRLAEALDRLTDGIRSEEQHRSHVRAELAGARASARLLAVLPLFALLLASGLGMNPLTVLLTDPFGRIALVCGLALDGVGLWWTARIVRAAERSS